MTYVSDKTANYRVTSASTHQIAHGGDDEPFMGQVCQIRHSHRVRLA